MAQLDDIIAQGHASTANSPRSSKRKHVRFGRVSSTQQEADGFFKLF